MITYEDECCGCATPSYPCMGSACPNRSVPHLYCDRCKEEADTLYEYEGEQVCIDCILESLNKVEIK